jgi:hypothetical protein
MVGSASPLGFPRPPPVGVKLPIGLIKNEQCTARPSPPPPGHPVRVQNSCMSPRRTCCRQQGSKYVRSGVALMAFPPAAPAPVRGVVTALTLETALSSCHTRCPVAPFPLPQMP